MSLIENDDAVTKRMSTDPMNLKLTPTVSEMLSCCHDNSEIFVTRLRASSRRKNGEKTSSFFCRASRYLSVSATCGGKQWCQKVNKS